MKKTARLSILFLCGIILAALLFACGKNDTAEEPKTEDPKIVETQYGTIKGAAEDGIITFKGVPFAAPPVGDLRFKAPQEPAAWEEIKDCTSFAPSAVQPNEISGIKQDEDCLYLNIWSPEDARKKKNLPVFIWIHGGAFANGSPAKPTYEGSSFAKSGIIQINVTYRLNALGFFGSKDLVKENGVQGNLGLLDQIAALKWVKENIKKFGGDPENITIGGESAGAFSVSNLMVSPLSKGLFQRAILESGNILGQPVVMPYASGDQVQADELADRFMASLEADSIDGLRKMDAAKIAKASKFNGDITKPAPYSFWPVFDGKALPENPYKAVKTGDMQKVDILTGYNTDEGSMFVPAGITAGAYHIFLERIFKEDAGKVLERFPVDSNHTATQRARQIFTMALRMGNDIFAQELAKGDNKVYYYNFDYHVKAADDRGLGVMHGLEMPFVFKGVEEQLPDNKEAQALSEKMHAYWANFMKTGDPNSSEKPDDMQKTNWPNFDNKNKTMIVFDGKNREETVPDSEDIDFVAELIWEKK